MNAPYYITLIVALIGIAASIFIKAENDELALIYYKDKQFSKALILYKSAWKSGNRTLSVAQPLAQLYLQYGKVKKAIEVMKDFTSRYPDFAEAQEHLGVLYKYAQRPDDYLHNLEKISLQEPSPEILRELSDIYNYRGESDKQIAILEKLIQTYDTSEKDYINLAYLYAEKKDLKNAIATFDALFDTNITIQSSTVEFAISILIDLQKYDKALDVASKYAGNIKNALRFASRMHSKGVFKQALSLLIPFENRASTNPELLKEISELKIELGEKDSVFTALHNLYKKNNLHNIVLPTFAKLALENKNQELLDDIVQNADLTLLPDDILMTFGEFAFVQKKSKFAKAILKNLGKEYQDNVVLNTILTLTAFGKAEGSDRLRDIKLSGENILILSQIFYDNDYSDIASEILLRFTAGDLVAETDIQNIAELYINLGLAKEGADIFKPVHEYLWVLLATAAGMEKEVLSWLEDNKNVDKTIYFIAVDAGQQNIALKTARRLYKKDKNNRSLLANILVANNLYAEALPLLRVLVQTDKKVENDYIYALIKTHNNSGKELKSFLDIKLPEIPANRKREIAFALLEYNYREYAEDVFFSLVENATPDSKDVAQLLYLWGPVLKPYAKNWLKNRISNAGVDLEKWLQKTVSTNHLEIIIELVEAGSIPENHFYTESLIALKKYDTLAASLKRRIKYENDKKNLLKIAKIAKDNNLSEITSDAFRKILSLSPNDQSALKEIGLTSYYKGDYSEAKRYLGKYLSLYRGDYIIHYTFGELLLREKRTEKAKKHFQTAMYLMKKIPATIITAHLFFRLGNIEKSVSLFRKLLKKNPLNKNLRVDFVNVLMEMGRLKEAEKVLGLGTVAR